LGYALLAVVGLILALTWGALQIQVTLAGFLNGESLWSKAQKQSVVDLNTYAGTGGPADLAGFHRNRAVLDNDRYARDRIASGTYDYQAVAHAFAQAGVMQEAIPGMIFIFDHFPHAPHIREAIVAWRSVDDSIAEMDSLSAQIARAWAEGTMTPERSAQFEARINELNRFIGPQTDRFSLEIAQGATWLGRILFIAVFLVALLASLLWLRLARRILKSIRGTEERYSLLFGSAADAIVMIDDTTKTILDVNDTAVSWTGRSREELIGRPFATVMLTDSSDSATDQSLGSLLTADGRRRPVEMHSNLVVWGERTVCQAIVRDISERLAMEQERRTAAEALASIAEGVIIADADRRVTAVNAAQAFLTGFSANELLGHRFDDYRQSPDGSPLPASMWATLAQVGQWTGEVLSQRRGGDGYPERLSISTIRDGEQRVQRYVAVFTDITDSKANQQRLEHLAAHDPLTGLVNRAEFERHAARAIQSATRERGAAVVLFIDLDAFKAVNDSYSHAIGDRLLQQVADRIRRQLSSRDLAGRIGGDEFTVLLPGLRTREAAGAVVSRLLSALSERFVVGDYELFLSASIGIAGYPLDGSDPTTLIANADAAMYSAKTEERNTFRYYTPRMHADARRRLELAAEMRLALTRDEFYLVYQPSVELRSGRIVAVEALIRWQHPQRGLVMPDEFIPIAESLGLIRQIDEWVIRTACAQVGLWDAARMPAIRIAINVSASWFGHPEFVHSVSHALQESRLTPSRVLLEVTESAILKLGEDTERTMRALHALGVGVAIDDFGTGYSSLSYLKLPAVAFLKIDRSFVTGLPGSANDVAIVEAMIAMSRSLGLCTIAEGIENDDQHEFLLRAGCAEGQGYLYSRPISTAGIERLLSPNAAHAQAKLTLVPPSR
jgi:diguanylate cyclase (GGDEF)-like protein/PAS domain S-box-containing protein